MKKVFLASGVFFIISIALVLGGFAMADWNVSNLSTKAEAQEIVLDVNQITQLTSNFKSANITVSVGEGEQATVKYNRHFRMKGDEKQYLDNVVSTVEGEVWTLTQTMESKRFWSFATFGHYKDRGVEIILPSAKTDMALNLINNNGSVTVQDVEVQSLNVDLDNGRIKMSNTKVQTSATLKSDNGATVCENVSADSFTVDLSNGAITLETVTATTFVSAKANNGNTVLLNCQADTITAVTKNGRIECTRAKANTLDFKTNNGAVEGSIVGAQADFAVSLDIGNGSANISESTTGSKVLRIETDNGSAKIDFVA